MNGIEGGAELVQTRHLTRFSTPLISIYILTPYKFIGADEMILEEETFEKFGYYPSELPPYSHRPVLATCDDCGKVRKIRLIHYSPRCKRCADKKRGDTWKNNGTMQGANNPNYGKPGMRGENNPNYGNIKLPQLNDREWLYNQYHVLNKNSYVIAKSIGCHPLTVLNALRRKKIRVKTIAEITSGENNPNWKNGVGFEPYCHKFNEALKEEIRDTFGRVCFLCPKTEEENGIKLSVHHVDYNKQQGCNGVRWLLVPLCRSCNSKVNFNRDYWQDLIIAKLTGREEGEKKDND